MRNTHEQSITNSIARYIKTARRQVTILFTDIEYSTFLWDVRGDIEGRLMVDKHNRLLFPVIREYRGRVLKTIGDAIMASFRSPEDALKAAIGIQQALAHEREHNDNFYIKVRIGIHTGMAIVEHDDVFGDVVNMASRIENEASGDEILVSEATAEKFKDRGYFLVEAGVFLFRGKRTPMKVFRCEWQLCQSMIEDVRFESLLPVGTRQRLDLIIYLVATLGVLLFMYHDFLRFVFARDESSALIWLNPHLFLEIHPLIPALLAALLTGVLLLIRRLRQIPLTLLRFLQGGFGFCIGFFALYVSAQLLPDGTIPLFHNNLYESRHQFVRVLQDDVPLYHQTTMQSRRLGAVGKGDVLLVVDQQQSNGARWNRVAAGRETKGWLQETVPARLGVPEIRLGETFRFKFQVSDLVALLFGVAGFLWSAARFRVRPT
jgi:class 3 adenylate cyclase